MTSVESNVVQIDDAQKSCLYRHFDKDGKLLYIGISLSPFVRTRSHRYDSDWFESVAQITIEWHETRESALDAECLAIFLEQPKFNTMSSLERLRTFFCPLSDRPIKREIATGDDFTALHERLGISRNKLCEMIGIAPNSGTAYALGRQAIPLTVALACEAIEHWLKEKDSNG